VEWKLQEVLGDVMSNAAARKCLFQGMSFMVGRNVDYLILLNKNGFNLIWRERIMDPSSDIPRYQYLTWPYRHYASLNDDANAGLLHTIIGELARICACKALVSAKKDPKRGDWNGTVAGEDNEEWSPASNKSKHGGSNHRAANRGKPQINRGGTRADTHWSAATIHGDH
jgi:hypothetical protein